MYVHPTNVWNFCQGLQVSILDGAIWSLKKGPAGIKEPFSFFDYMTEFTLKLGFKTEHDYFTKVLWGIKIIFCSHKSMFHACPHSELNVFP